MPSKRPVRGISPSTPFIMSSRGKYHCFVSCSKLITILMILPLHCPPNSLEISFTLTLKKFYKIQIIFLIQNHDTYQDIKTIKQSSLRLKSHAFLPKSQHLLKSDQVYALKMKIIGFGKFLIHLNKILIRQFSHQLNI